MSENDDDAMSVEGSAEEKAARYLAALQGKDRALTRATQRVAELEAALVESSTAVGSAGTDSGDDDLRAQLDEATAKLAQHEERQETETLYAAMPEGADVIQRRLGRRLTPADRQMVEAAQMALDDRPVLDLADRPRRPSPPNPLDDVPTPGWSRERLLERVGAEFAAITERDR